VLGQKPGRKTENEITVFKSVGFGRRLVTAHLAYQRARAVGSEFRLEG
jgi:ornithine cyclodeaminase/alanine dehydrogenase-like protein (mu-crystallin family)